MKKLKPLHKMFWFVFYVSYGYFASKYLIIAMSTVMIIMNQFPARRINLLLVLFITTAICGPLYASDLFQRLARLPGVSIKTVPNNYFQNYFEICFNQPTDHFDPLQKEFQQRLYIGIKDLEAPVIIETDGYAIEYAAKIDHFNEIAKEVNGNLITVEHRFCGKSLPEKMEWQFLTVRQAAEDYHRIRKLLDTILVGNWISTGISKGGQAALGYKIFYPNDVKLTVVYGTAVKSKITISSDSLLADLSKHKQGKKVAELQEYYFHHKPVFFKLFESYCTKNKYKFSLIKTDLVFDYILLEFPFSYWQRQNKSQVIPDTLSSPSILFDFLVATVSPRFYSDANLERLKPSFYMFYHEFGYYEYDVAKFKSWLSDTNYSNKRFAPIESNFDHTYMTTLNKFIKTDDFESVYFIYGENDPWALQSVVTKNKFVIKSGDHKSRIINLDPKKQTRLKKIILKQALDKGR